jgi:hypothetical protein
VYQADIKLTLTFLKELIKRSTSEQAIEWLDQRMEKITTSNERELYLSFSAVPRYLGKEKLKVNKTDRNKAEEIRTGFDPSNWTITQTARTMLLLSFSEKNTLDFHSIIEKLFDTAEMGELIALYAALPLLPHPELFTMRAAEGIRTNMGDVFEAIALNNPYPADYLSEEAWNNMVLKTLFVGKPLYKIYGIDKRCNPRLARMLADYAHERWAAGRNVSPELWRPISPYIDHTVIQDIKRLFSQPNQLEQEAAALACNQSDFIRAKELLNEHPQLKSRLEAGEINWQQIGTKSLALN